MPNNPFNPIAAKTRLRVNGTLGGGAEPMNDAAGSLRRQLNGDLLLAMKARNVIAVSALRSVLSALDNASAVPSSTVATPVFGRNGDVPRRDLSEKDCQNIINAEIRIRAAAADEYARLGKGDVATRLRAEQAVVERYTSTTEHAQQSVEPDRREDAAPG